MKSKGPALVLALGIVAATLTIGPKAEVIEQVLVKVNGEIFTKTQLEARQVQAIRQAGQTMDPKPTDAQLKKMLDDVTPQLLVMVIDELLMIQRAKELNFTMSDAQFKSIIDDIRKEQKLEDEAVFQAALKQENMTLADLRRDLERRVLADQLRRSEVTEKISVTEEELRKYYDEHMKDFTTSQSVTLREIMIAATAGSPTESDARQRIDAIRARAVAGESYEKLASDLSDSPSRSNGGLIGPLNLDDLAEAVRTVIEPLKVGEITPVLRTPTGYQLLKLDASTPKQVKTFEQARDEIGGRVIDGKQDAEMLTFIEKLRTQAIIEWKNKELQKAYEAGLKASASRPAAVAQ